MKYTIAKYLRISAEDIDLDGFEKYESNSIANQRALLDDFIVRVPEFDGCEVIEELDDGRTGTNFLRPGVQRLIEMAQSGKVNCIIVKDLSRWGRNYIEVGDFLEQKFPAWNIRFISLNDCYDSAKLNGTTGGIDIAFRNLCYDLYSQDLSEKVRSGKLTAAKNGKTTAVGFYGYVNDCSDPRKLNIDELAADIVRRIFNLTAQGVKPIQIVKILNDENIPTPQQRKIQLGSRHRWIHGEASFWQSAVISKIIHDERYTGKLIYGKTRVIEIGSGNITPVPEDEWIVVPGAIPMIITEEQYNAVNNGAVRKKHTGRNESRNEFLLSEKLKCGHCGLSMRGVRLKNGNKYYCRTWKSTDRYGCGENFIFEKDVAEAVLVSLRQQFVLADSARDILTVKNGKLTQSIIKMQKELTQFQAKIEKSKHIKISLWEKYHSGTITGEQFQCENEKADSQSMRYTEKVNEIREQLKKLEVETGRENLFVERFGNKIELLELTREIVVEFINEIKVYSPDRIEIVFNFKDEYERIAPLIDNTAKKRRVL